MAEYEIEVKCKNCGKAIAVLAPSRWGYKKRRSYGGGWDYFCTWKCLREDEKKHEKKQKAAEEEKQTAAYRDREAELRKLIREVKNGKDPYEYLKKAGYANPKDTMRRLRLQAKDEWPELYTEMVKLGLKDMRKGNGKKMGPNRMTPENKAKAVDIAIAGGDYIAHLKECGAKNPHASWSYIKQQLSREDPAKYDELMEALAKAEPKVIITKQLPLSARAVKEAKKEIYAALGVPEEAAIEKPEEKPITKALVYDGLTVTAVTRHNFGIQLTGKNGEKIAVVWPVEKEEERVLFMKQITELKVEQWKQFMEIMPKAMRILGVDI